MNTINYYFNEQIEQKISKALHHFTAISTVKRIWDKDPFLWVKDAFAHKELQDRLGWLSLPETSAEEIKSYTDFANEVKNEFTHVLLLGMGGSSLAPEVFAKTFGSKPGFPSLSIIDSTHPTVIKKILATHDLKKTLFAVASKSGGTAETNSFFSIFYSELSKVTDNPGNNFIAFTDPNTKMENIAKEKKFRKIFSTPPEVGGRYSVLSPFGMVPAALMGIDISLFLEKAHELQTQCKPEMRDKDNPGFKLGVILGEFARAGTNKVTFITTNSVASFPQWVEQLVAESTGKEGKGILPIVDEPDLRAKEYSNDRLFVFISYYGDNHLKDRMMSLIFADHPVISIEFDDLYELGKEFFRWEFATAVAGVVLNLNPFDQPDVQSAKTMASESLATYISQGALPVERSSFTEEGIEVFTSFLSRSIKSVFDDFFFRSLPGEYIAILSFVEYDSEYEKAICNLKRYLLEKYHLPVTSGYGPRFLHSTGQLHKGGPNTGYFIQITNQITDDIEVPGQGYSFGVLISAQSQGDLQALINKNRRTLRFNIKGELNKGICKLFQ